MKEIKNNSLRASDVSRTVTLYGWVQKKRDLGGVCFIDLRDRSGIVQLVARGGEVYEVASGLKSESVLKAEGTVVMRESKNPNLDTGDIEVELSSLEVLNSSRDLPFEIIINSIRSINWYIWEILWFYLVFYLVCKFDSKKVFLWVTVISVVFIFTCYCMRVSNTWYGSTLCFPLGILMADKKEFLMKWVKKKRKVKFFVLLTILTVSIWGFFYLPETSFTCLVISRNLASISFVLFILLIIYRIKIGNQMSIFWEQ